MHQLPPLPYAYEALEPYISAEIMKLHHQKHHATYVDNLNKALEKFPDLEEKSVQELLINLASLPAEIQTAVLNNSGGHLNHTLFWESMAPNAGGEPRGALAEEITKTFGSFTDFQQKFNDAGLKRFGSGWVWLVKNPQGKLEIISTPNQDSPIASGHTILLGNDVWEHAYYLQYKNVRADYLKQWWNLVNWDIVSQRFTK